MKQHLQVLSSLSATVKWVLTVLVLMGGAAAGAVAIREYSPWAWQSDFTVLAGQSCQTTLTTLYDLILQTQVQEANARKSGNEQLAVSLRQSKNRLIVRFKEIQTQCKGWNKSEVEGFDILIEEVL